MFKIQIDKSEIQKLADDLDDIKLDVEKHLQWYINQVYASLAKQHGRRWTYQTPPTSRKNVYLRSGRLRSMLRQAKYVKKIHGDTWEAGFRIRPGTYLDIHVGERDEPPTVINALGTSNTFLGRMTIPLRAALNSNGTPKALTPRTMNNLLILPFHVLESRQFGNEKKPGYKPINDRKILSDFRRGKLKVDWNGENTKKFHPNSLIVCKRSGRRLVPLFVLAKQVKIPKRIFIGEKMRQYEDRLWQRLNNEIDKKFRGI